MTTPTRCPAYFPGEIFHSRAALSHTSFRPKGEAKRRSRTGDFPGGPVVKTPHSQCREPGFDPWSGDWILCAATETWAQSNKFFKKEEAELLHGSHRYEKEMS